MKEYRITQVAERNIVRRDVVRGFFRDGKMYDFRRKKMFWLWTCPYCERENISTPIGPGTTKFVCGCVLGKVKVVVE